MNILITRHDKIGDFIVTLPLFKCIKDQYPDVKLTALVSKINYELAKNIEFIDDVIIYEKNNFTTTLKKVKAGKFDISISAYIDTQLGFLLFLAGIKQRISPATKIAQIFFNKKAIQKRSSVKKTEWKYNLELGRLLFPNLKLEFKRPILNCDTKKEKKVILHPGFGGSSDGNLTLDDYIQLGRKALQLQYEVVFTFGPDDNKSKHYIKKNINYDAKIVESNRSLIEFAKYISTSKLFISTSTGPMHLAGALNLVTLSFFGKTLFASSKRWAPINETNKQNNFMLSKDYTREKYKEIESKMCEILL